MTVKATFAAFGAVAAINAAALAAGADARAETLSMLSSWDESYSAVPVFAQRFAERLAEKSDGEVTVQMRGPESVAPFEQLQPVATGLFDMLFTHGAYHLGETAMAFGLDAVEDDPVARRESGLYDLIDAHYQDLNLKFIGAFSAASGYHVLLKAPIGEDGAFEGRRIRASGTYHDFITELGGSVVTLPASEIYSALDRGVVEGAAWPVFGALDYGWYEVADYMTRPAFGVNNHTLFMNLDRWNALSPDIQELIVETAAKIEIEGREHFETLWSEEDEEMQARGLEITEFGRDWADRVDAIFAAGVWRQVEASAGEEGRALHERALELGLTAE